MKKASIFLLGIMMTLSAQARHNIQLCNDSIPSDSIPADSIPAVTDSLKNDTIAKARKPEKKETEYEKLLKKGGVTTEGLFTVRHIEDKYYFEVPDDMLGRMLLCVTRFTAVPQSLGKFAGEEVSEGAVYFEKRDTTQLLLRQYVQSHLSDPGDQITRTLLQSTVDPMIMSFKIIGRNKEQNGSLVEVTGLFKGDNQLTSLTSNAKTALKVGGLQADRTFVDTMKVFPTNIEVVTTRTYGAQQGSAPAAQTGSMTMGFNTSIVLLPETPMRKRLWDKRV